MAAREHHCIYCQFIIVQIIVELPTDLLPFLLNIDDLFTQTLDVNRGTISLRVLFLSFTLQALKARFLSKVYRKLVPKVNTLGRQTSVAVTIEVRTLEVRMVGTDLP